MGLIPLRPLLAFMLLVVLGGCAAKNADVQDQDWKPPAAGTFLSQSGRPVSDAEVAGLVSTMDFLLLGEGHTNPCDHAAQARLLEILLHADIRFSLGLEMLPVTAQPALDQFNTRTLPLADLAQATNWTDRWGYPFSLYAPIFALAEQHAIPVAGLNIPRPVLTAFRDAKGKDLPERDKALLPQHIIAPCAQQQAALREQARMHRMMRESQSADIPPMTTTHQEKNFFLVQSLWDSMLAEQALKWRKIWNLPVVVLAGAGHVEHGWGMEYRIRMLDPTARCLSILPIRDHDDLLTQSDPARRCQPGATLFFFCRAHQKSRLGMVLVFEEGQARTLAVTQDSAAEKAGLLPGDILLRAGQRGITALTDLHFAAMDARREKQPLELTVRRQTRTLILRLPLP